MHRLRAAEAHVLLVALLALQAALLLALAPDLLLDDSWLSLVSGRAVWQHGIPHHDTVAVLTAGRTWIDDQWLAQLLFYGTVRVGGLGLLYAVHVAVLTAAAAIAMALPLRRGAKPLGVFAISLLALLIAPWSWQPRAQSFAELFFAVLLALTLSDPQAKRRRTLLVLPLLVLWANVHGSVLLGIVVVLAYAFVTRAWVLLAAPFAAVCTPYGFGTIHYYVELLGNRHIAAIAPEWRAPTGKVGIPFFVLAAVALALLVWRGRLLRRFEIVVLLLTLAAGLTAVRHFAWFGLTAIAVLPPLVPSPRIRTVRPLAWVGAAAIAACVGVLVTKPDAWYEQHWPTRAGDAAAAAVRAHPAATIFVHGREDDWLLWQHPSLEGHIAYDARLELLKPQEIQGIVAFDRHDAPGWTAAARPYTYVWVNSRLRPALARALASRDPVAYRDAEVTLLRARKPPVSR